MFKERLHQTVARYLHQINIHIQENVNMQWRRYTKYISLEIHKVIKNEFIVGEQMQKKCLRLKTTPQLNRWRFYLNWNLFWIELSGKLDVREWTLNIQNLSRQSGYYSFPTQCNDNQCTFIEIQINRFHCMPFIHNDNIFQMMRFSRRFDK